MSRSKQSQQSVQSPVKPKFNTKPYERPGLTEEDILQIKENFDLFDKEHVGSINPKELKQALESLGEEAKGEAVYQLVCDLDGEGAGNVTFEQFIHLMTPRLLEGDSRENIGKVFALFDDEKTGFISLGTLRRIAREMAFDVTEEDIEDMMRRGDADKDGRVSEEEFYELVAGQGR